MNTSADLLLYEFPRYYHFSAFINQIIRRGYLPELSGHVCPIISVNINHDDMSRKTMLVQR